MSYRSVLPLEYIKYNMRIANVLNAVSLVTEAFSGVAINFLSKLGVIASEFVPLISFIWVFIVSWETFRKSEIVNYSNAQSFYIVVRHNV